MAATNILAAGNFGSPFQLLILLVIILLLFGGNRLRSLGSDLGGAIKGFKNSMAEGDKDKPKSDDAKIIEGKVVDSDKDQHKPS
jgi:sec-independent protein translocase protein TatA